MAQSYRCRIVLHTVLRLRFKVTIYANVRKKINVLSIHPALYDFTIFMKNNSCQYILLSMTSQFSYVHVYINNLQHLWEFAWTWNANKFTVCFLLNIQCTFGGLLLSPFVTVNCCKFLHVFSLSHFIIFILNLF